MQGGIIVKSHNLQFLGNEIDRRQHCIQVSEERNRYGPIAELAGRKFCPVDCSGR